MLYLRKAIIELELKPGEPLIVKDIASKLEVSRSPVRDSIMKLGKEGLVDIVPQKGTYVSKIDLDRVDQEQFIRSSLEEKVIELFVDKCTPNSIIRLESLVEMQKSSLERQDYTSFLDYDDEMHSIFFYEADKQMSWDLIYSMSGHYRRFRLITLWDMEIAEDIIKQHKMMIQYIKEKDVNMAVKSVKDHTMRILSQKVYIAEKHPDYFQQKDGNDFLIKNFIR